MYPSVPPEAMSGVIQILTVVIAAVAFFVGLATTARS
jgi:hypothetical protein